MKRALLSAAAATALLLSACSGDAAKDAIETTQEGVNTVTKAADKMGAAMTPLSRANVPHAQLPETVIPSAYRIAMTIDPKLDGMTGTVAIDAELPKAAKGFWMHAKDMTISAASIRMGDTVIALTPDLVPLDEAPSGLVWMAAEETIPAGTGTVSLEYATPYNQNLNSAYKVVRGDDAYIVTQMEPLGAREAFPSFDEPKYKQPFTLSITAPVGDVVVSNTPKTAETPIGDDMVRHDFATTRPLPTYLIAFAVGPYDIVDYGMMPPNSVRKTPLALRGIAAKGEGKRLDYALKNTDGLMTALEEYFGIPYPYEKLDLIAAPDYAFGAMENPGLIVYREYLLLLDDNAPLSQQRAYARVHSHELAHQWFGNLVTPVWWEDIWLNEAFATWMGNKGLTLWRPDGNFDRVTLNASLGAMNIDTLSTTRKVREPLERSENVMDQFDGITYRKGGGVLDMFESYVGVENFQKGVRLHMARYADDVATADDFFQSIADGSGNAKVVDAMKSFVDQKGLPLVAGKALCETEGNTTLMLSQSRYAPLGSSVTQGQTWQIPVCANFIKDGAVTKACNLLVKGEGMLKAPVSCADAVMPNANGAGYYRFTLDSQSWQALFDNLDHLNTREVLSAQDSLNAAFRAGEVEPAVFLSGMETLAKHPEYDVASKAGDMLGFIYSEFPDARDDTARLVRDMYAKRYADNVGKDTLDGQLLVPSMAAGLTRMGGDAALAADFAAKGKAYLSGDKDAVASNLVSRALREYAIANPGEAIGSLKDMVKTGSALEKGAAVGALGTIRDTALAADLRGALLTETDVFTGRQALSVLSGMMGNEVLRDDTWAWVKTNFDALVARVPDVRKGGMPGLATGCSIEERDAAKAFFTEKADLIPGYERSLAQTLERTELCAALKAEVGDGLVKALAARP